MKKYITSVVMVLLAVLLVIINIKGINPVVEAEKVAEKIGDEVSGEADKKRQEEEKIISAIEERQCNCDFWKEKYKDWEEMGYRERPIEEYDPLNKTGRIGAYGIPKAFDKLREEMGKYTSKYSKELKKQAPEIAFSEDGELAHTVLNISNISKIGEKMCCASYLTDITVKEIKVLDNVKGYDNPEGIMYNDFYLIADKDSGKLNNSYPQLNPEKYPETGELAYVVVSLELKCNSPWVVSLPIDYIIRAYEEKMDVWCRMIVFRQVNYMNQVLDTMGYRCILISYLRKAKDTIIL